MAALINLEINGYFMSGKQSSFDVHFKKSPALASSF